MPAYVVRLVCLCLASFLLVHFVLTLAMHLFAPGLIEYTARLKARVAANLLFSARLFPVAAGVLVVAGICVPSYLWLEPEMDAEQIGPYCLAAALLSLVIWTGSIVRAFRALRRSRGLVRRLHNEGQKIRVAGEVACVVEEGGGLLALAGIRRSEIFISRQVLEQLSEDQLQAALEHERAHRTSQDNLKRLLLILAPRVFSSWFRQGQDALEQAWERFSEYAADDRAAAGDRERGFSLAGALVRVARLGGSLESSPLMTSFVSDSRDLEARVQRLLDRPSEPSQPRFPGAVWVLPAWVLAVAMIAPGTLRTAHRILEFLIG